MKLLLPLFILFSFLLACKTTNVQPSQLSSKRYVPINDSVLISIYETSNLDYRIFLNDLLSSNRTEEYLKNKQDTSKWGNTAEPYVKFYHAHPSFNNYPVVTISYENATSYCDWLTEKYNADMNRKFRKVLFRLPTEKEWMFAASAGHDDYIFPWKGWYIRNSKGNFLANFRRFNDADIIQDSVFGPIKILQASYPGSPQTSSGTYAAPVNSFFKNELGIYNMAGNVAEIVDEKGITKGGSFYETGYYLRIRSRKNQTVPAFNVGFRVVMQVVEK